MRQMEHNYGLIVKGFCVLRAAMAPYVVRELIRKYGSNWWQQTVLKHFNETKRRKLPRGGDVQFLTDSLDIQACLHLFRIHWENIFWNKHQDICIKWVYKLIAIRNNLAHIGGKDFDDTATQYALDIIYNLCDIFDSEKAQEIIAIKAELGQKILIAPQPLSENTISIKQTVQTDPYSLLRMVISLLILSVILTIIMVMRLY